VQELSFRIFGDTPGRPVFAFLGTLRRLADPGAKIPIKDSNYAPTATQRRWIWDCPPIRSAFVEYIQLHTSA
jgi:hypothetical protein